MVVVYGQKRKKEKKRNSGGVHSTLSLWSSVSDVQMWYYSYRAMMVPFVSIKSYDSSWCLIKSCMGSGESCCQDSCCLLSFTSKSLVRLWQPFHMLGVVHLFKALFGFSNISNLSYVLFGPAFQERSSTFRMEEILGWLCNSFYVVLEFLEFHYTTPNIAFESAGLVGVQQNLFQHGS